MSFPTDAEKALLALQIDGDCRYWSRHAVKPEWFTSVGRRQLFEIAARFSGDYLTCLEWSQLYSRTGIPLSAACQEVAEIMTHIGAPVNVSAYASLTREAYERRKLAEAGADAAQAAKDATRSPGDIALGLRAASEIVARVVADSVRLGPALREEGKRDLSGQVPTGFPSIDALLGGGMLPGWLVTVAGRTSMGKTAFALDVTRHCLADHVPVGYVTLEMRAADLWARLEAVGVEHETCVEAWYPLGRVGTPEIRQRAMDWTRSRDGLGLLIVDHLQLVSTPARRNRYEGLTEVVHDLKSIARDSLVPMVMLSQLSRETAKRDGHRPNLADLRDTGAIEEDSDVVILLHRPGYYEPEAGRDKAVAAVAKNRHGETGNVPLIWTGRGFVDPAKPVMVPPHIEQELDEHWK